MSWIWLHLRFVFQFCNIENDTPETCFFNDIYIENDTRGKKNYRSFVTVEKEELEKFCNSVWHIHISRLYWNEF